MPVTIGSVQFEFRAALALVVVAGVVISFAARSVMTEVAR
jgi:hypothetical protein